MTTVADYIVERFVKLGITECFGVPGDFAFPLNDALEKNSAIKWIGNANELNAAYAADGYARIKGAALICTTYAVGELSALNGIMGAKAENSVVFHLVGMPSMQHQLLHKRVHHSLGDGVFKNFVNISAQACCVHAVITPDNCVEEMERVIATALTQRQPAYIIIPRDTADLPINGKAQAWAEAKSNEKQLNDALTLLQDLLNKANSPLLMPGYMVSRYGLQKDLLKFVEKSGLPFTSMFMDKSILPETHPNFLGMYFGESSSTTVHQAVENSDLVINFGNALFTDFNTAGFDFNLSADKMITFHIDHVRYKDQIFYPVYMKDVVKILNSLKVQPKKFIPANLQSVAITGNGSDRITAETLYQRFEHFFKPNDIIVTDSGSTSLGLVETLLPEGVTFFNQTLWGSIGWATGAAVGTAIADTKRRTVLITGDGAHQLTANEIGTFGRFGLKPVIFVLNNGHYMVEDALQVQAKHYDELTPWQYHKLPETLGCKNWFTTQVTTLAELDTAMREANKGDKACYIEIIGDPNDFPPKLAIMHERYQKVYGG